MLLPPIISQTPMGPHYQRIQWRSARVTTNRMTMFCYITLLLAAQWRAGEA